MSNKLLDTIKPIKYFGNIFGFIPFCLNENYKNYQKILILNRIYLIILILIMIHNLHFNVTVAITWFREASMMPDIVHQFIQAMPMTVSIILIFRTILHEREFLELLQKFNKIDKKVRILIFRLQE